MSTWSDSLRHITVQVIESNSSQRWALVEVRFGLAYGSPLRPNEVQIGLYCDGEEIAVGYSDAQGRWRIRVEGLNRNPAESIFEAQARISLGRARSEMRTTYQLDSVGKIVSSGGSAEASQSNSQDDDELKLVLPELKNIKMGTFWMSRSANAHRVRISRALAVSKVPVTQDLYTLVMGNNPSRFLGDKRPVEQVSFWEAIAFCNKLSDRCGLPLAYQLYEERGLPCVEWIRSSNGYRLLTEAEWEYAAKASRESNFAGGEHLPDLGWYQENSKNQTHTVGQKEPNTWGLYDFCGNVWEWCFDEWDETAYDGRKGTINQDPFVANSPAADRRVRRGGAWVSFTVNCSVNYRFWGRANARIDDTGFRIARTL